MYFNRSDLHCSEAAMRVKIGAQQNHHLPYVRAVDKLAEIAIKYELTPWMWSKIGFYLSGYAREFNRSLNVLTTFSSQVRAIIRVVRTKIECASIEFPIQPPHTVAPLVSSMLAHVSMRA
jgi:hypothetical protein